MASLRESLLYVLSSYAEARKGAFAGSAVASYIRGDLAGAIRANLVGAPSANIFSVKGSSGQSGWADIAWGGIFHDLVTGTAQEGYYVVYLFKRDLSGVFLSLNQGVTTVRQAYKSSTKEQLRRRAEDFRARLGTACEGLHFGDIDLAAQSASGLAADYEAGSVVDKFYPADGIPDDGELRKDLHRFLGLYISLEMSLNLLPDVQEEEQSEYFEDTSKARLHTRIERNQKLIKEVKRVQGYRCRACGFDFSKRYRDIGEMFIEAHHLTPLSELDEGRIKLDPIADFVVLCANCHRMIHRTECIGKVDDFRARYLVAPTGLR